MEIYNITNKESIENLTSIDKTILIFDYIYNLSSIKAVKKYRNKYFENGEAKTMILDSLRDSSEPMRTDDLGNVIASKKDLSFVDENSKRSFSKSIINVLTTIKKNNLVERVDKGLTIKWQIKKVA